MLLVPYFATQSKLGNDNQSKEQRRMRILRAEHLGMCFGVRDAITLAVKQAGAEPLMNPLARC